MKVLFISFYFPPIKAIASVRTWNLCKGLLAAGHEVQVVAPDEQAIEVNDPEVVQDTKRTIDTHAFSKIKVSSAWPELYGFTSSISRRPFYNWFIHQLTRIVFKITVWLGFDPMIFWAVNAWKTIRNIDGIDLILVSGGPFSTFLPATLLAKKLKCPLVLDYRDVWNGAPHVNFRLSWKKLEQWWLKHASLVTSVSPSCLESILESIHRPNAVITNGVSDHIYEHRKFHLQPPNPIIVYAGAFYPPMRSADPIFAALSLARNRCSSLHKLRFVYLGPSSVYVKQVAAAHGLENVTDCLGVVCHRQCLEIQAQALCTVVVTTVTDIATGSDRGIVTGKLFEAIELSRNVIVICPTNSDVRALASDIQHVKLFTGCELDSLSSWLIQLFNTSHAVNSITTKRFSWLDIANQYVGHLEKAIEERSAFESKLD